MVKKESIKTVEKTLNVSALSFTLLIIIYGFQKGYDNLELILYIIYFLVVILTQIINLTE